MNNGTKVSIPDELMPAMVHYFSNFPDDTVDFSQPVLKKSLKSVFPLFVLLYGLLILVGLVANVTMAHNILKKKLLSDSICGFLLNIAVCNLFLAVIVLPLSLAILLIQNWVFGKVLCYIAPMLQDIPVHATTASLVAVDVERFRAVVFSHRSRLPSSVSVLIIWVVAFCVVFPYTFYMSYIDVEKFFGPQFKGVGICAISLDGTISQYIRGLFILLYAFPLVLIMFLHARIGAELRKGAKPSNLMALGPRPPVGPRTSRGSRGSRGSRSSQGDVWTPQEGNVSTPSALLGEPDCGGDARRHSSFLPPIPSAHKAGERGRSPSLHQYEEADFDLQKEKRDQRYIAFIVLTFALCLCPLMILRLVKNILSETDSNSAYYDLTYISFVWIAFLPTISTPMIYGLWRMSRPTMERLQGYLKFNPRAFPSQPQQAQQQQQQQQLLQPQQPGSRRCSANPYGLGLPTHSPNAQASMRGHRLSVEATFSVMHPHGHVVGRPLTPTPSHSHAMNSLQNPDYGPPERFMRPHSLSFS